MTNIQGSVQACPRAMPAGLINCSARRSHELKSAKVHSDMFGVSGREMLAALIGGESNPQVLAQMARTRMRTKIPQLQEAFVGHFTDHHRFLLAKMLARIDALDVDIADLDTKIEAQLAPFADAVARLDEIPGVGATASAKGAIWSSILVSRSAMSTSRASMRASILVSRNRWWSVKCPTKASCSWGIFVRIRVRAICARTWGLLSPPIRAASISRPETPNMSLTTTDNLIWASLN